MPETAKAFLLRCGKAIREPEFAAYVYENARAPLMPPGWERRYLQGRVTVTEREIIAQEMAKNPSVAYNSLVRVKVMNLADSFASQITRELAKERAHYRFWTRVSPTPSPRLVEEDDPEYDPETPMFLQPFPGDHSLWWMEAWWVDPKKVKIDDD